VKVSFLELFERAAAMSSHDGGLARRSRKTYWAWLKAFSEFTGKPAREWRAADVSAWMHRLDRERYSIPSRRQALCAVVWAFKRVLRLDLGVLDLPTLPREQARIRIIPSRPELARIFAGLKNPARLMAGLMYGAGLRVSECCELRVKDVDFDALTLRVHGGKGDKDRLAQLPVRLVPMLRRWLEWRAALHANDVDAGAGYVELPNRLAVKFPGAVRELPWQYVFPSAVIRDRHRWHRTPKAVQEDLRDAVRAAGITKTVTPHTLRAAFATHALRCGNDLATVQELMGHESAETTLIYIGADGARGVSPLDFGAGDMVPQRRALA
jgi:site-specific recombinase XerD